MTGLVLIDEDLEQSLRGTSSGSFRLHGNATRGSVTASQGSEMIDDFLSGRISIVSPRAGDYAALETPHWSGESSTLPTTSFASPPFGVELPSTLTEDSSSRTAPRAIEDDTVFSFPVVRRNPEALLGSGARQPVTVKNANLYAGTSSGLKISVRWILIGVVVGVVLGILLAHFKVSSGAARWVSLPGDLFLRALKCLVVPYVFCSVAVAIGDIVFVGKVSIVGLQTAKVFVIMWIVSVAIGVGVALCFRPLFRLDVSVKAPPQDLVGLTCPNNLLVSIHSNGTIACDSVSLGSDSEFTLYDINNSFQKNSTSVLAQLSLSDQLMLMITPIVSDNIIASLANGQLLSTITFAMVFGSIAGRNYFMKTREVNYVYLTMVQLRNTFFLMMEWTIWLSPLAVISIIAGSFATNQSSLRQFEKVYVYVLAAFAAAVVQMMIAFPCIVYTMTRCNPFSHMRQMARAYIFAFACSSSLATAPVTLTCARKAEVCSQSLANFVISIGVTSNVSAVGFYVPIAVIFVAESSGNGHDITAIRLMGIFVLSLLSCSGVPPIPAAGLVTISTVYMAIFGVSAMPNTFAYVVAMGFLVDRFVTVCDVNDDVMALKVIAENTDETVTQEVLGERY